MSRQTIAIDIDDVLSANAEGFAKYSNRRWGHNITAEDYTENWAEVWGVPLEEALERANELHASGAFGEYQHIEQAVPVLKALRKKYDLVVVTSRRTVIKPETDRWVERHFPGLFSGIHYAGIWDNARGGDKAAFARRINNTKAELCREIGAEYLIDDQVKHCVSAAEAGITCLLFGDYKWNRSVELPKGIVRVQDWDEVARYFHAQS